MLQANSQSQTSARPPPGVAITRAVFQDMPCGTVACLVTECESFFPSAVLAAADGVEMEPNLIVEINEPYAVLLAKQAIALHGPGARRIVQIDVSYFPTIGARVFSRDPAPEEGLYDDYHNLREDECVVLMVNMKEMTMCSRVYSLA